MTVEDTSRRNPFSWLFGREKETPTKTPPRRPVPRDFTGGLVANDEMLRGAYHGTWSGLQFASPLMFTPVNVPVTMMGLPTPHSDDERTQQMLDEITSLMSERIIKLNRAYLLSGTAWRFPRFDSRLRSLVWEAIPDSSVSDILLDVTTGRPTALLTDDDIVFSVAENQTAHARRKRRFDSSRVSVSWSGHAPAGVNDYSARNVGGILPVPFAHDSDESELRGYSVFSRIIRDLKDYHDIDYRVSEILTKFVPKQLQEVDDIGEWCKNNLGTDDLSSLAEYDVSGSDFILNRKDKEKTDYKYLPGDATAAHEKAIERKYWKIFEGSGIPEMFWGGLASGNHATADNQTQEAVAYVEACRREITASYYDLYAASLRIMSIVRMEQYKEFTVRWNALDSVSPEVKSKIFQAFAQAITSLAGSASMTKKQLFTLWTANYPESDPGTFEEFLAGTQDMAQFQQFKSMDYASGLDFGAAGEGGVLKNDTPENLDDGEGEA